MVLRVDEFFIMHIFAFFPVYYHWYYHSKKFLQKKIFIPVYPLLIYELKSIFSKLNFLSRVPPILYDFSIKFLFCFWCVRIFWRQMPSCTLLPFNVSEILGCRKILFIIGGITICRRKIFVSQCRKISWASLQCFRKIGVPKNFIHNRGYHNFPSKLFCLTVPKNFVKEPFSVSLISGIKKC